MQTEQHYIRRLWLIMKNRLIRRILSPVAYAKYLGVRVGDNCKMNRTISFGSEPYLISIGNDFYCSTGIKFITHDGSINVLRNLYSDLENADLIDQICVGNNVFLGSDVTILPGTNIGDNVIVGACSVVKGELEGHSVYAGIPAKKIMSLEKYKEKNIDNLIFTKNMSQNQKKHYLLERIIFNGKNKK